jgi:hypothetical protein
MADAKISELTELTTLSGDETFPVVEDDDGTPVNRRITVENLGAGLRTVNAKVWDGSAYTTDTDVLLFVDPTGGHDPATASGGRSATGDLWLKPPPKELAHNAQSAAVTGITTETDITGATISFTVTAEQLVDYPVVIVEAMLCWVFSATAAANGSMVITDNSNVAKKYNLLTMYASGAHSTGGVIQERITAAGSYTRKLRVSRSTGTGTISVGLAATASTFGHIRAFQVAQ